MRKSQFWCPVSPVSPDDLCDDGGGGGGGEKTLMIISQLEERI